MLCETALSRPYGPSSLCTYSGQWSLVIPNFIFTKRKATDMHHVELQIPQQKTEAGPRDGLEIVQFLNSLQGKPVMSRFIKCLANTRNYRYFPVSLIKVRIPKFRSKRSWRLNLQTVELPSDRRYVFGYHPHGKFRYIHTQGQKLTFTSKESSVHFRAIIKLNFKPDPLYE